MSAAARRAAGARSVALAGALLCMALLVPLLAGCEPKRPASSRPPWAPQAIYGGAAAGGPGVAQPIYAARGPDPYSMPGGSEARDPWSPRTLSVQPAPGPPAGAPEAGLFLIVTMLQGPLAEQREPAVNALIARLGGVRRAPSLWEVAPVPGGGLGSVAAALEAELCAEDIVVIYRARNQALERSEFAGHKACVPPPLPPAAPAPRRPAASDPLRTRF